jgi:hypothetical protein
MNPDEKQDSTPADGGPKADGTKVRAVQDENRDEANRTMPGRRAGLPPGSLRRAPHEPQADENRDQPAAPDGTLTVPTEPPRT